MTTPRAGDHSTPSPRRHLVGVVGLVFLSVGIYFYIFPPESGSVEFLQGSCVKSGLILLVTWLAFPQLDKLPIWLFASTIGALLVVAVRPRVVLAVLRYGIVFIPIVVVIWCLRPKRRRGIKTSNPSVAPSPTEKIRRDESRS